MSEKYEPETPTQKAAYIRTASKPAGFGKPPSTDMEDYNAYTRAIRTNAPIPNQFQVPVSTATIPRGPATMYPQSLLMGGANQALPGQFGGGLGGRSQFINIGGGAGGGGGVPPGGG